MNKIMMIMSCLILVFLFCLSCSKEFQDITITGTVKDLDNKNIENAVVFIQCWKYAHHYLLDELNVYREEIRTDEFGNFEFKFEKGLHFDVAVKADGYYLYKKRNIKFENSLYNNGIKLTKRDEILCHPDSLASLYQYVGVGIKKVLDSTSKKIINESYIGIDFSQVISNTVVMTSLFELSDMNTEDSINFDFSVKKRVLNLIHLYLWDKD